MINKSKKLIGPFLIDLRNRFKEIAGDDQLIDKTEFRQGLGIKNYQISDRLFDIFDKDDNGSIDYDEFMNAIKSMVDANHKEKIEFAFELHDLDNSGFIDRHELKILIQQSFLENHLDYDEFQLDLLVDEFFKVADEDGSGTIDVSEFLKLANNYPDFMEGLAVNPLHWLIPDRYEVSPEKKSNKKKKKSFNSSIQVQDIGVFQWLLIPRLIFLYNILTNRKKNRSYVKLQSIKLLPSRGLELAITAPKDFLYKPGDYLYLNCKEVSFTEWYPFNIINKTDYGDLILHVKSSNHWANKLYDSTLKIIGKDTNLNWRIRIDGPYGSSSKNIINLEHAVLVGAGNGISRIAPILQDIMLTKKNNPEKSNLKQIDLYWLIEDRSYFEWFTKMLKEMEEGGTKGLFNYHIYFVERSPDEISRKMMYISTDIHKNKTSISLVDNLWSKSRVGIPDWNEELGIISSVNKSEICKVFYSGPLKYVKNLKDNCRLRGLDFVRGAF